MEISNNLDRQLEVTYKFYIPDNEADLLIFQNATNFYMALLDIHERCRHTWKYKEDATAAEIELAERIGEIVAESGVFDNE